MPQALHIIFAGTPAFAVPSLELLAADSAFVIDLVITQPDEPVGRKQIVTPPPVKLAAEHLNLPIWQPKNINKEFGQRPAANVPRPDLLIVVAYGQILSLDVLAWPSVAPINVHASLLPRWRGASPIQHAILSGDTETGVTVQRMVQELDAGPIFGSASTSVAPRETFASLHDRLATMGATLLVQTVKQLPEPNAQSTSGITVCRKLTRADGQVEPEKMTAAEIDRTVRSLVPWPGVRMKIGDEEVKILETAVAAAPEAMPISCKEKSTLYVLRMQSTGGKPMSGVEWMRGHTQ